MLARRLAEVIRSTRQLQVSLLDILPAEKAESIRRAEYVVLTSSTRGNRVRHREELDVIPIDTKAGKWYSLRFEDIDNLHLLLRGESTFDRLIESYSKSIESTKPPIASQPNRQGLETRVTHLKLTTIFDERLGGARERNIEIAGEFARVIHDLPAPPKTGTLKKYLSRTGTKK